MMRRRQAILVAVVAGIGCVLGQWGWAQGPYVPYRGARVRPLSRSPRPRPLMSPYFDLYRRDSGPLPNYYQFVIPRLEAQRALKEQATTLQRQQAEIYALRQQVTASPADARGGPTGIGSVFMNYLHYYPALGPVRRTR